MNDGAAYHPNGRRRFTRQVNRFSRYVNSERPFPKYARRVRRFATVVLVPQLLKRARRGKRTMNTWVRMAALLASAVSALSCGGGGTSNPPGPSSSTVTISITGGSDNFAFSPNPADAGGRTVVFRNNTAESHRVVLNDFSIDTGDIPAGATSRSVVMPTAGTNYHCSTHDKMGGAITPQSGGAPPACEGVYCY
jgi:plastocyanin